MAALDFPASPAVGAVFGNWTWDGTKWTAGSGGGGGGGGGMTWPVQGVTDASNGPTGTVGESYFISFFVQLAGGANPTLSLDNAQTLGTFDVDAGDWELSGSLAFDNYNSIDAAATWTMAGAGLYLNVPLGYTNGVWEMGSLNATPPPRYFALNVLKGNWSGTGPVITPDAPLVIDGMRARINSDADQTLTFLLSLDFVSSDGGAPYAIYTGWLRRMR